MNIFYQAPNARTGDVIPKYIDGTYQLFYLKGWKDRSDPAFTPGWHRMESRDLLHMSGETPIHVLGGTGDLVRHQGRWHLFACIFPEGKQLITHYISRDGSLDHWDLQEEDTFGPDGVIYHKSDWRDPRIVFDPKTGEYRMYLAARVNAPHSQTGCVGLCTSRDLKHWTCCPPAYYPQRFNGALECPDFFTMGRWEYLVFSSYTTLFGTYYVKRPVGEKQWRIPRNHRLDSRAFYAAKTAGHDMERYLFGWIPTKEENIFGFWPDKLSAQDYRTWDWGGSMAIHRLTQLPDGDLAASLPETRRALLSTPAPISPRPITDGWELAAGRCRAVTPAVQQMLLMGKMPDCCRIRVDIRPEGASQAGIVLRAAEDLGKGYYLYIEPEQGRLVFRSWLRMYEEGGKTFPYDTELEVPVRKPEDGVYSLELLIEGTAATAYVNGSALSFRMYDLPTQNAALFSFGPSDFQNFRILTAQPD